jgi:cell division protein FtsL
MLILYGLQAKKYKDLTKEVVELERKQEKLIEENKRIVSEISVLTNAERIEKIAVEELGMHKAEAEDIVRVEMTGEKK